MRASKKYICNGATVIYTSHYMEEVEAICSLMLDTGDLGMDRLYFIFIIFLMGLLEGAEMIFVKDNGAIPMLIYTNSPCCLLSDRKK